MQQSPKATTNINDSHPESTPLLCLRGIEKIYQVGDQEVRALTMSPISRSFASAS